MSRRLPGSKETSPSYAKEKPKVRLRQRAITPGLSPGLIRNASGRKIFRESGRQHEAFSISVARAGAHPGEMLPRRKSRRGGTDLGNDLLRRVTRPALAPRRLSRPTNKWPNA